MAAEEVELELWLLECWNAAAPAMMMMVVSFHLRLLRLRGVLRLRCPGLLRALNIVIQLCKRALCLSQIAGGKRLAERIQIVRNGVVAVGGSRGGG